VLGVIFLEAIKDDFMTKKGGVHLKECLDFGGKRFQ